MESYTHIILSPGPGLPDAAGLLKPIIETYGSRKKILGVCLGLQAIGEVYNCSLRNLEQVYHGITSDVTIVEPASRLYANIETTISVGRYHSWVIDEDKMSNDLLITARDQNNEIMSIEHRQFAVYGVQYHPESIMTPKGKTIVENFLRL